MAKVHKRKARKDYPREGIKKGEEYYTWSLRPTGRGAGTVYRSKTAPTPQQLESNPFRRSVMEFEDRLSSEGLDKDELDSVIADIRSAADEEQGKFDNMPEGLQQGETGQKVEGRANSLNEWADELEGVDEPEEVSEDDITDDDLTEDHEFDPEDFEDDPEGLEKARKEAVERAVQAKNDEALSEWRTNIQACEYGGE